MTDAELKAKNELIAKLNACLAKIIIFLRDKAKAMPDYEATVDYEHQHDNGKATFHIYRTFGNYATVSIEDYQYGEGTRHFSIYCTYTDEQVKTAVTEFGFNEAVMKDIICAWKLDGLKGSIVDLIDEASSKASAAIARKAKENEVINNFEA